jgi:4-hydroxy-tetrahydrodipicolinate reductase
VERFRCTVPFGCITFRTLLFIRFEDASPSSEGVINHQTLIRMKIALLGNGTTGSYVNRIAVQRGIDIRVFDTTNEPSSNKLSDCDVVISFLPGEAFLRYIPTLLSSGLPVVNGGTGFNWPDSFEKMNQRISNLNIIWITGTNFSIGSQALLPLLRDIGNNPVLSRFKASITEWHHVHKKDAPSGTAISWMNELGFDTHISSFREGDIIGVHELTLESGTESIVLRHEVRDRGVFAEGALFVADLLIQNKHSIRPGLYELQGFMDEYKHLQR